jgi:hypothetical protein
MEEQPEVDRIHRAVGQPRTLRLPTAQLDAPVRVALACVHPLPLRMSAVRVFAVVRETGCGVSGCGVSGCGVSGCGVGGCGVVTDRGELLQPLADCDEVRREIEADEARGVRVHGREATRRDARSTATIDDHAARRHLRKC